MLEFYVAPTNRLWLRSPLHYPILLTAALGLACSSTNARIWSGSAIFTITHLPKSDLFLLFFKIIESVSIDRFLLSLIHQPKLDCLVHNRID